MLVDTTVEYSKTSKGPWQRVRTVAIDARHRFVYLKTHAKGPYFRVTWNGEPSRLARPR